MNLKLHFSSNDEPWKSSFYNVTSGIKECHHFYYIALVLVCTFRKFTLPLTVWCLVSIYFYSVPIYLNLRSSVCLYFYCNRQLEVAFYFLLIYDNGG